jgi:hypothetical protein
LVQRPRRGERRRRPGLQAHPAVASGARHLKQVGQHGPADTAAARRFGGVHRLDLRMVRAEALDRPDAEQAAVGTHAEKGDLRIEQPLDAEREAVLGRGLPAGEVQVPFQQRPDIRRAWVVHGDLFLSHYAGNVPGRCFQTVNAH